MVGPEHRFQQLVVQILDDLCGCDVYVISQPRAFLGTPGIPDLLVIHERGIRCFMELKAPEADRGMTDHQELFRQRWERAGGDFALVDSPEALEEWCAERGFEVELS